MKPCSVREAILARRIGRNAIDRAYQRARADGKVKAPILPGPGTHRQPTPGWVKLLARVSGGDAYTVVQRWANEPWFASVRYLGPSRGYHVFERPPTETKP